MSEIFFTYAGHLLTVEFQVNPEDLSDIETVVISKHAHPIEGGFYPANFAEGEASSLIFEAFTGKGGDLETLKAEICQTVAELVNAGIFGQAN